MVAHDKAGVQFLDRPRRRGRARHDARWHTDTAAANSLSLSAKRHCGALSIAVSGVALGTRSNFIIAADRIRAV
jgi:hypothetical protein